MTIFEKIAKREIPADIVFEDDEIIAFRDIAPVSPHHIILTTKRPIATTNDLSQEDARLVGKLTLTAARLAKDLKFSESGYRLVMNCNEDGGQSVDHIHLHLLGGRKMSWPPG